MISHEEGQERMNTYQNPVIFPEQNEMSGIGDPFVFRHNGRYYLCPSPSGVEHGIILWESEDMAHWTYVGNIAQEEELNHPYAPEMFYYNGTFYLMGSPRGEGHYLYTSDSPKGPFKKLTDCYGMVIDGSMYADDDGSLYFLHAEYPSIYAHSMKTDGSIGEAVELYGTSMGHWTEGPGVFKRGDKYYITMTGNHLISRGYRIDYAVSDEGPLGPYRVPRNKCLLVNTAYEYGSLGHSSNVIGPDLDSYWIFYHSFLIDREGNKRGNKRHGRFTQMDRMVFSGDELHVSGPTRTACPVPEMPDFCGWADEEKTESRFIKDRGLVLSKAEMTPNGTAEVAFVPGDGGSAVFGWKDDNNALEVALINGRIVATHHKDGESRLVFDKALFEGFRQDVLHTVRLEGSFVDALILVDHMQQGRTPAIDLTGKVGTKGAERTSYVAFTGHVNQSSDRLHYHYVPGFLPGLTAMQAYVGEVFAADDGEKRLLMRANDTISYRINVAHSGVYRIQAVLQAFTDIKAKWSFKGSEGTAAMKRMGALKRVEFGVVELEAGLHEWSFTLAEGEAQLRGFDLFLAPAVERGELTGTALCYAVNQIEGEVAIDRMEGLQMDRPGQVLCQLGDRFHTDGFIEADVIFRGDEMRKSAGLFLRVSENSTYPDQVEVGHRGYYVGFNGSEVFIWRMDFDKQVLAKRRCPVIPERSYTLRAEISGNAISVYVDGQLVAEAVDNESLPFGVAALGGFGSRVTFMRAKYELR